GRLDRGMKAVAPRRLGEIEQPRPLHARQRPLDRSGFGRVAAQPDRGAVPQRIMDVGGVIKGESLWHRISWAGELVELCDKCLTSPFAHRGFRARIQVWTNPALLATKAPPSSQPDDPRHGPYSARKPFPRGRGAGPAGPGGGTAPARA